MRLPRNLVFLKRKLLVCMIGVVACLLVPLFFVDSRSFNALLLGSVFSYFIFWQFLSSQSQMLMTKKTAMFFLNYFLRLIFYAVPIGIGLFFEKYLNFFILLISLFIFQFTYVLVEFVRSYKKVRRQQKQWKS